MLIEFEPNFVEHAVFEAARRHPKIEADLHRAIDPVYDLEDEASRNKQFRSVYLSYFQRLRLDRVVSQLVAERSLIPRSVRQCMVREARSRKSEGAELYVRNREDECTDEPNEDRLRTIVVQIFPDSLVNRRRALITKLRHELLQIADMLDDRFGYEKQSLLGRLPRENLVRDRYRVLWDAYTDGRLMKEGLQDETARADSGIRFARVFPMAPRPIIDAAVTRVIDASGLTHERLLEWANSPEQLFGRHSMSPARDEPAPGEPCPVCGCATHDWCDLKETDHGAIGAVRRDFPQWQPSKGICRQCADIYAAIDASKGAGFAT